MSDQTTEAALLDDLDNMSLEAWTAIAAWCAPKLCQDSPRLMMEVIFRRAQLEAVSNTSAAVAERAVNLLSVVGVKLSA